MSVFKEYESIKNHTHDNTIQLIRESNFDASDIEWVATEKIHGANFCVLYDGSSVLCARRRSILEENESFYNWKEIRDKYRDAVISVYEAIHSNLSDCGNVYIYGEIYGGAYPHPDVPRVNGVKAVQNGIFYRPDVDFYPFDVFVDGHGWLSYDYMMELLSGKFFFAEVLHRGTFDDCFNLSVEFDSTIPSKLGLHILSNNISEGIVIKPVTSLTLPEGDRVVVKKKHPNFSEVQSAPVVKKPAQKKTSQVSDQAQLLIDDLDRYITDNRLRNVISKETEIEDSKQARANLVKLYTDDIWKDYLIDNFDLEVAPENDKKAIFIALNRAVSQVIGKNWAAITTNTF